MFETVCQVQTNWTIASAAIVDKGAEVSRSKSFRKSDQLMILSLFLPKQAVSFSSSAIERKPGIGVRHDSGPRKAESSRSVVVTVDSDLVRTADLMIRLAPVSSVDLMAQGRQLQRQSLLRLSYQSFGAERRCCPCFGLTDN